MRHLDSALPSLPSKVVPGGIANVKEDEDGAGGLVGEGEWKRQMGQPQERLKTKHDGSAALCRRSVNQASLQNSKRLGRGPVGSKQAVLADQPIAQILKYHNREQFYSPNGPICTRHVTKKRTPISIRAQNLPRRLHTSRFSRSYLEFRPWKPNPNDLRGETALSRR